MDGWMDGRQTDLRHYTILCMSPIYTGSVSLGAVARSKLLCTLRGPSTSEEREKLAFELRCRRGDRQTNELNDHFATCVREALSGQATSS
jgi:hypothetical protein